MSLYDKYNVNPYIKTYVGAPVQAFQNTAGQLQKKYYDTIDRSNVMKQGLSRLQSMTGDKAYLEQIKAKYEGDIEQMLENPELANRAVRTLAGEFMIDKDLQLISKNKTAFDKIEKELVDKKASHIQRAKFQDAIDRYNISGGAAKGQAFTGMAVYEEQDLMDEFDKLVKGIKGIESADSKLITGPDGSRYIQTTNHGQIPVDKIRATALGLLNDPSVQRQLQDESNYHNKVAGVPLKEDGTYDETHEKYRSAQDVADGYIRSVEAKYYSVDDSDKLTGGGKGRLGARKGTLKGGAFGNITQMDAEDEKRSYSWGIDPEKEPEQVRAAYDEAVKNMELFESGEADVEEYSVVEYAKDEALVIGHNRAYKEALKASELQDDPQALQAVGNIPEQELYKLDVRTINKEQAKAGLDNIMSMVDVPLSDLFDFDSRRGSGQNPHQHKLFNKISDLYGPEVAGAIANEFYPGEITRWNPGRNVYSGHASVAARLMRERESQKILMSGDQEAIEDLYANTLGEMLENAKQVVSELPDQVRDGSRPFKVNKAKELLQRYNSNLTEDQLNDFSHQLHNVTRENLIGTTDYMNALEDGSEQYGVDRQSVLADGILSEGTMSNIKNVLSSMISDYTNLDKAQLDAIEVLDEEGNVRPLTDTEELEKLEQDYQFSPDKIRVTNLDSQHGRGMVKIELEPISRKEGQRNYQMWVNLDATSPDIRNQIAEDALYRVQNMTSNSDREKANMVYTSFAYPVVKQDLDAIFRSNNRGGPDADKLTTDALYRSQPFVNRLYQTLGQLTPIVTDDNKFNFKMANGNLLFIEPMASTDRALSLLLEKMDAAEQRIASGYIGTPIAEPDSPDDMSNSSALPDNATDVVAVGSQLGRMPDDINYNTNL
jgi:hypothetical protein